MIKNGPIRASKLASYSCRTALILLAFFAAYPRAAAQQLPNMGQGLTPFSSYQGGKYDQVNLSNGNVFLKIPLASYPQRGALSLSFSYIINQQGWQLYTAQGSNTKTWIAAPKENHLLWSPQGDGPVSGFIWDQASWPASHSYSVGSGTATYWSVIDSTGANHPGVNTSYGAESNDATGYRINVSNGNAVSVVDRHGIVTDVQSWLSNGVISLSDPNGNTITENTNSGAITDTLNRQVSGIPVATSDFSGCSGPLPIAAAYTWAPYPGFGGQPVSYKFCYANVAVHPNFPDSYAQPSTTWELLQSIVMPNGHAWTFEYQDRDPGDPSTVNYGNLTRVTFPTGGSISYTYTTVSSCSGQPQRFAATRTVDANDGAAPQTWRYTWGSTNAVTSPSSEYTVYTFGGGCSNQVETQRQYYQNNGGRLLKTVATAYKTWVTQWQTSSTTSAGFSGAVPTSVTTTLDDGETSQVQTDYDSGLTSQSIPVQTFGDVTAKREYGYGSGSPGALLRQTLNSYLIASGNSSYFNTNMLDLVTQTTVEDSSGTVHAQTTYNYDEYSLQPSGTPNLNTGVGTQRGNITSIVKATNFGWVITGYTTVCEYTRPYSPPYCYQQPQEAWEATGTVSSHTTYYDSGMPFTKTDPNGNVTTIYYSNSYGGAYPTETDMPSTSTGGVTVQHRVQGSYDFNTGLITQYVDQNGNSTYYNYDPATNRITRVTYSGVADETDYSYNDTPGSLSVEVRSLLSANNWSDHRVLFDGLGRTVRDCQLNAQGSWDTTDTTYDGDGRKLLVSKPYASSCAAWTGSAGAGGDTMSYDALDRTTQIQHIDGTVSTSQYSGSSVRVTDEAGKSKVSQYNALGELTSVCEVTGMSGSAACNNGFGANGYLTTYSYDILGNLSGASQTANTTASRGRSFTYDALSRLISQSNPETGTITYTYDNNGNLISKGMPAPNQTGSGTVAENMQYDALNRLTSRSFTDGITQSNTYDYDLLPNGASVPNGIGHQTYESNPRGWVEETGFDVRGRLTSELKQIDVSQFTTSFGYYNNGALSSITYPDGMVVNYGAPDPQGREVSVNFPGGSLNRSYSLGGAGNLGLTVSDSYPNGLHAQRATNNRFQPWTEQVWNSSQTLLNLSVSYTGGCQGANNGNIISQSYTNGQSNSYCYDDLNRITSSSGMINESFSYDPYGNMLNYTAPDGVASSNPIDSNNKLNGGGFTTDAAGRVIATPSNGNTQLQGHTYSYFSTGEICAVDDGSACGYSAGSASYLYDGHDRRVEAAFGSSQERHFFYLGGSDKVIYEMTNFTSSNDYIYLGDERVADIQGGAVSYYFPDHIGSTALMTDGNGNELSGWANHAYTAFGEDWGGSVSERRRFTGKERDPNTGLDYFEARYNSSSLGRFMTPDALQGTIANPQTLNRFVYVADNPLRFTDPTGMFLCACGASGDLSWNGGGNGLAQGHHSLTGTGNAGSQKKNNNKPPPKSKKAHKQNTLHYKKGVPPASPALGRMLGCTQSCTGFQLTVTSTTDEVIRHGRVVAHGPNTPHGRGEAADVRELPGTGGAILTCASVCGAKFGLDEGRHPSHGWVAPHVHLQITPGRNGGRGDLPMPLSPEELGILGLSMPWE